MNFKAVHNNFNVSDLDRSVKFYHDALGLEPVAAYNAPDGSFKLIFVGNAHSEHTIELTWFRDKKEPYDLGDNGVHLAFRTEDFEGALKKHREMGCICLEKPEANLYYIQDPDGYWLEVLPML